MDVFQRATLTLTALFLWGIQTGAAEPAKAQPVVTKGSKQLPLKGEALVFNGREAFLIRPKETTEDQPWVLYAPTLPRLPGKHETWLFQQLLENGIAIAGIDVGESYGSPTGQKHYTDFHAHLVASHGFSPKPCLLARSRGGLMLGNWAAGNPEKVAAFAGIYPVCNITSYPGVNRAAGAYEMTADQLQAALTEHNPISQLAPLARQKVPYFLLHGDKDRTVPLELNSGELAKRYRALGGPVELVVIEGGGHDVSRHWFTSTRMRDFIVTQATKALAAP